MVACVDIRDSRADSRMTLAIAAIADLTAAHHYLATNDPGIRGDPLGRAGAANDALVRERATLALAEDRDEAHTAIGRYLRAWRHGHLWVTDAKGPKANRPAPMPTLAELSPTTLLIRLPSFDAALAQPLVELLDRHCIALESHPNWMLDVRGGQGGFDQVFAPLLPWIMPHDWRCVGVEFLATRSNADAHERIGRDPRLTSDVTAVLARLAASIRQAREGDFVRLDEEKQGFTIFRTATDNRKRPARVAILADAHVYSSSEEFILTARSSPLVRVFGQPTAGVLDYSNCRPWPLPSGERTLWYATSRSLRLPENPIDGLGITPDRPLPAPATDGERDAEIDAVRQVIEREPDYWTS